MVSAIRTGALPALVSSFLLADHRIAGGGTPGWSVVNLRGSRDAGPLRLRMGVENLGNEAYRTHGSGVDGVGGAAWVSIAAGF